MKTENKDFQEWIKQMESEIMALKTASRQAAIIKSYTLTVSAPPTITNNCIITYGSGVQPILSEFYYGGTVMPYQPDESTNTQKVRFYAQSDMSVTIVSARPIISIVAES